MNKKVVYGTFSAVSIMIVIAALVLINLVIEKLDIQVDLTPENVYTISDKSKEALQDVQNNINIYVLSQTGNEDSTIKQILNEYSNNCSKLSIEYKDPYIYPTFAKDFAEDGKDIETNSIIVQCDNKHRVIKPSELYETQVNYNTGTYETTGISAESEITNAIRYVSTSETPIIYYVSGHNEMEVSKTLKTEFEKVNYEIKNLNIIKDGGIPDDCSMLFITTPGSDYSDDETEQILKYLSNDGKAAVFLDWSDDKPNINKILSTYGVKTENALILEGDKSHYYNAPMFIIPDTQNTEVTKQINESDYTMIFPYSQGISETEIKKSSLTIEPLLKTSNSAYSKVSKEPKSVNFEEGDKRGPFNLAVGITDSYYTDTNHITKLIVCGSSLIINDEGLTQGSLMFAINSANWLKGEEVSIYIPSKSLEEEIIVIPEGTAANITMFVCGVIPIVIFATGIFVWYKRRYS